MMSVNLNDIAILNKSDVDYLYIRNGFNKRDAVNLLQNADLNEMRRVLQKWKKKLLPYIKWEIITLSDTEVEKHKSRQHKSHILMHDVNIDRIVVSNIVPFGEKVLHILLGIKMILKKIFPCV